MENNDAFDEYSYDDNDDYGYDDYEVGAMDIVEKDKLRWLTPQDIYNSILQLINSTKSVLNMDSDQTLLLLKYFQWNKEKLEQNYFSDTQNILKKAGIHHQLSHFKNGDNFQKVNKTQLCQCCFEQKNQFFSLICLHEMCIDCWKGYVENKAAQVIFQCPFEKCYLAVPHTFIMNLFDQEKQKVYIKWLSRLFCEESKTLKYCIAPNCDYICENTDLNYQEVKCKCGEIFCFKCGYESHRPCQCEQAQEWLLKNSTESENLRWIKLYTKLCPKCRRPIEKNQGCNHITCNATKGGCGHDFCWICLEPWSVHGEKTGGFYKCNKFDPKQELEQKKSHDKDKSMLEKYIFYFERYNNNSKSQEQAVQFNPKIEKLIEEIHSENQFMELNQMEFLYKANQFLIEGRRVLKWSYCYGFYINNQVEKEKFEFYQAFFDQSCDKLHELLEKNIKEKYKKKDEFQKYKSEVINLQTATEKNMQKVLNDIEEGKLTNMQQKQSSMEIEQLIPQSKQSKKVGKSKKQ